MIESRACERWPSLLDPTSTRLDVNEFDDCVAALQNASTSRVADRTLTAFAEAEGSFLRVDAVLSHSSSPQAQHIALCVLNTAIVARWNTLAPEQQSAIRNFLGNFVMAVGCNPVALQHHRHLVVKAAATLVSVAKHEWPERWPSFVADVIGSVAGAPEAQNALLIMRLLIEEVFECGARTMTTRWVERKQAALAGDFGSIFDLCCRVGILLQCLQIQRCSPAEVAFGET